jgi:MinD superfamily P-loop ATPase
MQRVLDLAAHFKVPAMVCINKFDLNVNISDEIEAYAAQKNLPVLGRIPFDPVFTRAMVQGKTLFEYDGNAEAGRTVRQTWQNISNHMQL